MTTETNEGEVHPLDRVAQGDGQQRIPAIANSAASGLSVRDDFDRAVVAYKRSPQSDAEVRTHAQQTIRKQQKRETVERDFASLTRSVDEIHEIGEQALGRLTFRGMRLEKIAALEPDFESETLRAKFRGWVNSELVAVDRSADMLYDARQESIERLREVSAEPPPSSPSWGAVLATPGEPPWSVIVAVAATAIVMVVLLALI